MPSEMRSSGSSDCRQARHMLLTNLALQLAPLISAFQYFAGNLADIQRSEPR